MTAAAVLERVDQSGGLDSCWEWQGARATDGYGRTKTGELAHRVVVSEVFGLGDGELACHHCDNPPCCNPLHLFVGSPRDNMVDMWRKGRHPGIPTQGELNHNSRLTDGDVRDIRHRYADGETGTSLAREYDYDVSTMYRIIRGQSWRHVK